MASSDLVKLLDCSICLNLFTDPVNLKCGHNFCRGCIDRVLDSQQELDAYSCPECREEFRERPALQRNVTFCSIVESFLSNESPQEKTGIFCSYCVDSPVTAVRSCLHCEASMCDKHLSVHSQAPEHVLCDPNHTLGDRKCPLHRKVLEYYCPEDSSCICVSCRLDGTHRGHQVEALEEASEKKKTQLRELLQKLTKKREEFGNEVQSLKERGKKAEERATGEAERVAAFFRDIRRQLDDLEKRALSELSQKEDQLSISLSNLIRELELKMEELSREMRHIEELGDSADPLTVLRGSGEVSDHQVKEDRASHGGGDLDMTGIAHTLHSGLSVIMSGVMGWISKREDAGFLLDENVAGDNLQLSPDMKTASWAPKCHRQETSGRFVGHPQVLSGQSVSSGQHFWDVDAGESAYWRVGLCYPDVERSGDQAVIGYSKKSWGLEKWDQKSWMVHNGWQKYPEIPPGNKIRIYLDYEAGQISFYDLGPPIRLIYTFKSTFTKPLHVAVGAWHFGCVTITRVGGKNAPSDETGSNP